MEDIKEQVQVWRMKAEAGTLVLEEMREAIKYLQAHRTNATTAAKKKGISKKVINSEDLLNELEEL